MKYLVFLLLLMSFRSDADKCTPEEEFRIRCETTCETDGDERAFVADEACYCANKRDIKYHPFKLNVKGKAVIDQPPRW